MVELLQLMLLAADSACWTMKFGNLLFLDDIGMSPSHGTAMALEPGPQCGPPPDSSAQPKNVQTLIMNSFPAAPLCP